MDREHVVELEELLGFLFFGEPFVGPALDLLVAIPSEKQIEQEFGVARGTARKAIGQLRADGLVVTVAGRGSYVADPLPDEGEII